MRDFPVQNVWPTAVRRSAPTIIGRPTQVQAELKHQREDLVGCANAL